MFADRLYIWSVSDRLFLWKNSGGRYPQDGKRNAGSTNALRTMGIKAGMITLLGDCFKCVIAVLVVRGIYGQSHADIFTAPFAVYRFWGSART